MGSLKYLHGGKVYKVEFVNQSESPLKILDGGKVKGIPLGTGPIKLLVGGKVKSIGEIKEMYDSFLLYRAQNKIYFFDYNASYTSGTVVLGNSFTPQDEDGNTVVATHIAKVASGNVNYLCVATTEPKIRLYDISDLLNDNFKSKYSQDIPDEVSLLFSYLTSLFWAIVNKLYINSVQNIIQNQPPNLYAFLSDIKEHSEKNKNYFPQTGYLYIPVEEKKSTIKSFIWRGSTPVADKISFIDENFKPGFWGLEYEGYGKCMYLYNGPSSCLLEPSYTYQQMKYTSGWKVLKDNKIYIINTEFPQTVFSLVTSLNKTSYRSTRYIDTWSEPTSDKSCEIAKLAVLEGYTRITMDWENWGTGRSPLDVSAGFSYDTYKAGRCLQGKYGSVATWNYSIPSNVVGQTRIVICVVDVGDTHGALEATGTLKFYSTTLSGKEIPFSLIGNTDSGIRDYMYILVKDENFIKGDMFKIEIKDYVPAITPISCEQGINYISAGSSTSGGSHIKRADQGIHLSLLNTASSYQTDSLFFDIYRIDFPLDGFQTISLNKEYDDFAI